MTKAIAAKIEELAEQDSMHESVDFGLSRMSFMSGARAYEALVKAELEAVIALNIEILAEVANGLLQECPDCDYECKACHKTRSDIDNIQLRLKGLIDG